MKENLISRIQNKEQQLAIQIYMKIKIFKGGNRRIMDNIKIWRSKSILEWTGSALGCMLQSDFIGADNLGFVTRNSSCLNRLGLCILERREKRRERERERERQEVYLMKFVCSVQINSLLRNKILEKFNVTYCI